MKQVPIPKTRDPFINTPVTCAGHDPETGQERYWCSTWNENIGALGALVCADGTSRIYRFERDNSSGCAKCGFYSAVLADEDTLWLCVDLAQVFRLTLSTGEIRGFLTGQPSRLLGEGMVYDPATRKLFLGTFLPPRIVALSFDTVTGETVHVYDGVNEATNWRGSFANEDGTYTFGYEDQVHKTSILMRWDPVKETLTERLRIPQIQTLSGLPHDAAGRCFLPGAGWLCADDTIVPGVVPERELYWITGDGKIAYGAEWPSIAPQLAVYRCDLASGRCTPFCEIPDCPGYQITLAEDGDLVAINVYGVYFRFDGATGACKCRVELDANSIPSTDCLVRMDDTHLLGTAFISQRFWVVNTETGEGFDAGRASPGVGEVMRAWTIGGKVYMGSYTEGVITEFDPEKPVGYPENPRIVATPAHSMRPMGAADDGVCLYSAATHHYGQHGFELTRYNTQTGEAKFVDDPIANQQMLSLFYNKKHHVLVGATSNDSDAERAPVIEPHGYVVRMNPETLAVARLHPTPEGEGCAVVLGDRDEDSYYICTLRGQYHGKLLSFGVYDLKQDALMLTPMQDTITFDQIRFAGVPGQFVLREGETLALYEICDLRWVKVRTVAGVPGLKRFFVDCGEIFALTQREILIFDL